MNSLLALLGDYTFQIVALGTGTLGLLSGVVGNFVTLRKQSLLGDAIGHAALPGIILAYMLLGQKDMVFLLVGAAIAGLIATWVIQLMSKRSVVKQDSAQAIVLTSFFGLGMILLNYVQANPNYGSDKSGLSNFIFGQASGMLQQDILLIVSVAVVLLILILIFWKEFKLIAFDRPYAQTLLKRPNIIEGLLTTISIATIVMGLETVGVILISSFLIGPAVAARQWTDKLSVMTIISGAIGLASAFIGTLISSVGTKIPTGPTIVVVISIFVFISLFFAPKRGIIQRKREKKEKQEQIVKELNQSKVGEFK